MASITPLLFRHDVIRSFSDALALLLGYPWLHSLNTTVPVPLLFPVF
jgi:hypothetical protein